MGAWSTGSKPSSKNAALVAALLTKEACIALGALVDDGLVWQTPGKAELEFVSWPLTETKATLAAGVRAVGLAATSREVAPASGAHTLLVGSQSIVTQRGFPSQRVAGVGASKHQSVASGAHVERGGPGWHPPASGHLRPEPGARRRRAVG
jgi:hypothetical protein